MKNFPSTIKKPKTSNGELPVAANVDELLEQNAGRVGTLIDSLRAVGEDSVGTPPYDDIWQGGIPPG